MRLHHLSHGFYRITDADAGKLARQVGKSLPKLGYELAVVLPNGLEAWLGRTPHQYGVGVSPKRGWVWAVSRRTGKEWTTSNLGELRA